jgi:nucleoside-triphosphatase
MNSGGFYTEEIRERGRRVGFRIHSLDAQQGVMAHTGMQSNDRVGKYGVDLSVINSLAVESLRRAKSEGSLIIIDEIGPMELLSQEFRSEVLEIFNGDYEVLGTVAKRKSDFLNQIRRLPNVTILEIFPGNREEIVEEVVSRFKA